MRDFGALGRRRADETDALAWLFERLDAVAAKRLVQGPATRYVLGAQHMPQRIGIPRTGVASTLARVKCGNGHDAGRYCRGVRQADVEGSG